MNFRVSVFFLMPILHVSAFGFTYLDATVPDLSHGVNITVSNLAFDAKTGAFSYYYQMENPAQNSAGVTNFRVDISQPNGAVAISSAVIGTDVRFLRKAANRLLASGDINVVPVTVESPPNWLASFGLGNYLNWDSTDHTQYDLMPSRHLEGFILRSLAPPGIRSFVAEPFLDTDSLPENNFDGDVSDQAAVNTAALETQLQVKGTTLGPTPPQSIVPSDLIINLVAMKHQAASLGWLSGKDFIEDLDEKLDEARKALAENKPFKARHKLREFTHELEEQRKEQLERHRADDDRRQGEREGEAPFISGNAFYLLKSNAEFIISKLPGKPEDDDREDDRR